MWQGCCGTFEASGIRCVIVCLHATQGFTFGHRGDVIDPHVMLVSPEETPIFSNHPRAQEEQTI